MKESNLHDWEQKHYNIISEMIEILDLPPQLIPYCSELWDKSRRRSPRIPTSLVVDCVYTVAHISGNRRSLKDMMSAAKSVLNRKTKPFNQDKRVESKRWIDNDWAKSAILEIVPDENILADLLER